jgi:predicted Zn-dependent peptidase
LARSPGFFFGYVFPPPGASDFYPLKLIEYVLFQGNSSRLYNKLIKKDRVASQLEGEIEVRGGQAVLRIFVLNNNEFMKEKSRKDILSEINKLKTTRFSEEELQKAKNLLKIDYVQQYATAADRAIFLSQSYLRGNSLAGLPLELEKYMSVTAARLTWAIKKYLSENKVFVDIKIK